ncbi:3-oxoacyl-ACP synthase III family protein [Rhodocaloribacter sp.]
MNTPVGILAAAYFLPPARKPVAEVFRDEEIPAVKLAADVDFRRDIGIEAVHVAAGRSAAELALEAVRRVMDEAGMDPEEIDLIVDFTSIPEDHPAPTWSAAGLVQREIGARRAFATAVNTGGCASFHATLKTVLAWMRGSDRLRTALLFTGDKTPALNHTYYPITVICDGGSATLLRKNHERRVILGVETATVGKLHDVWFIPGFHNRDPANEAQTWLHMKSDLPKFNAEVIPINLFMFRRVMRGALKQAGLKMKDVDYFIYPTFSTWDQRSFCQGFRIPPEKIYTAGLERHGHLQETDMVLNYEDAVREGLIREGDTVMVTTNGAGFAWGAAVIRH